MPICGLGLLLPGAAAIVIPELLSHRGLFTCEACLSRGDLGLFGIGVGSGERLCGCIVLFRYMGSGVTDEAIES